MNEILCNFHGLRTTIYLWHIFKPWTKYCAVLIGGYSQFTYNVLVVWGDLIDFNVSGQNWTDGLIVYKTHQESCQSSLWNRWSIIQTQNWKSTAWLTYVHFFKNTNEYNQEKKKGMEETFVRWFRPAFDTAYAKPPGNMPRSRPAMEEMLMIEPSLFAAFIRFPTAFDISHAPRRLVFMIVFHSSSSCVKGVFTGPTHIQTENKGWIHIHSIKKVIVEPVFKWKEGPQCHEQIRQAANMLDASSNLSLEWSCRWLRLFETLFSVTNTR